MGDRRLEPWTHMECEDCGTRYPATRTEPRSFPDEHHFRCESCDSFIEGLKMQNEEVEKLQTENAQQAEQIKELQTKYAKECDIVTNLCEDRSSGAFVFTARLQALVAEFDGKLSTAAAIGAFEVVKHELIADALETSDE